MAGQSGIVNEIIAGGVTSGPYIEDCFAEYPENCINPGIDIMVLLRVLHNAGIKVKWKQLSNFWEMSDCLVNGTIDIMARAISANVSWLVDCCVHTTPVMVDRPAFLVSQPNSTKTFRDSTLFDTYDWQVWFWLFISIVVVAAFLFVSEWLMTRFLQRRYMEWIHTSRWASGQFIEHILSLIFSLILGVVGNKFAITLATAPKANLPFNSYEDLLARLQRDQCFLITYEDAFADFKFLIPDAFKVPGTFLELMSDKTRRESINEFHQRSVLKTCVAIVDFSSRINFYRKVDKELTSIVYNYLPENHKVFWFRKSLPWYIKNRIELATMAGAVPDLYDRMIITDTIQRGASYVLAEQVYVPEILKMPHVMETFYLLTGGLVVAVIFILLELSYWSIRRANKVGWDMRQFVLHRETPKNIAIQTNAPDVRNEVTSPDFGSTSSQGTPKLFNGNHLTVGTGPRRPSVVSVNLAQSQRNSMMHESVGLYRDALHSGAVKSQLNRKQTTGTTATTMA